MNLTKETLKKIETLEIQKSIVKNNKNEVEVAILKELKKEVIKMKDRDRFNEKANNLRSQKNEYGLWSTFNKIKEKQN